MGKVYFKTAKTDLKCLYYRQNGKFGEVVDMLFSFFDLIIP
jgi:hypothetical protein